MKTQVKVQARFSVMRNVLGGNNLILNGNENMHRSGAKIYYRGGGWWAVGGYHYAGADVDQTIEHIEREKESGLSIWWHSHVNMCCGLTDQDEVQAVEKFAFNF
jgi:hypothetical protein